MVEHHRVAGVDSVGPWQELHSIFDGISFLVVQLQNGQANQSSNTLWIQLQGSTKSQTSLLQFVELDKTVAHPQPYLSYQRFEMFGKESGGIIKIMFLLR